MLWQGRKESDNVEDVRRSGGGRIAVGGGIGGVILVVAYLLLGGDPAALVDSQQQAQLAPSRQVEGDAPRDDARVRMRRDGEETETYPFSSRPRVSDAR